MQKRIQTFVTGLLFALLLMPVLQASAQYSTTFKPDATVGEDVFINTSYGCSPSHLGRPSETINWDFCGDFSYGEWTIYALGCSTTTSKALIRFTEMNTLPPNAVINYAELRLWTPQNSGCTPQGNSYYPGSPHPTNEGWAERVTSGWGENTVTWNTQPSVTFTNATALPFTNNQWNDFMAVNVTALTQDIWASMAINPANNNGYRLELQTAAYYRNVVLASSDDANPSIWPELYIEYSTPCNAHFNYCSSTLYPNTWNFTAMVIDPTAMYYWDFGDGNTGTGPSVTHTYWSPGSYKVCLTIVMKDGQKCTECTEICINKIVDPPKDDNPEDGKNGMKQSLTVPGNNTIDNNLKIAKVSPNPAHNNLDVDLFVVKSGEVSYTVYSVDGKVVISDKKQVHDGAQRFSLPIEKLPAGIYMLEVKDGQSQAKYKFVKE